MRVPVNASCEVRLLCTWMCVSCSLVSSQAFVTGKITYPSHRRCSLVAAALAGEPPMTVRISLAGGGPEIPLRIPFRLVDCCIRSPVSSSAPSPPSLRSTLGSLALTAGASSASVSPRRRPQPRHASCDGGKMRCRCVRVRVQTRPSVFFVNFIPSHPRWRRLLSLLHSLSHDRGTGGPPHRCVRIQSPFRLAAPSRR